MIKIILDFDGSISDFQKAFDSTDGSFSINDDIFFVMDYDTNTGIHHSEYGDIKITFSETEEN